MFPERCCNRLRLLNHEHCSSTSVFFTMRAAAVQWKLVVHSARAASAPGTHRVNSNRLYSIINAALW